jgi:hypothetical protein
VIGPSVETVKGHCPRCGHEISAASGVTAVQPKPDDVTICLYCASVLLFTNDLGVREPTSTEMDELRRGENWPTVQKVQRVINQALSSQKARLQ